MSRIKQCVRSRFEGGVIVEIDYAQLEVYIVALLSGDDQLIKDLNSGLDMHCMSATLLDSSVTYETCVDLYHSEDPYIVALRKNAKGCSFLVQFGGGWKALVEGTGVTQKEAKTFIANYYKRYPGVALWHKKVYAEIKRSRQVIDGKIYGEYTSPLGTLYMFEQRPPPWGGDPNISPTQAKNFPVQGTAADIVKIAMSLLEPVIHEIWKGDVLLINTIHDSFILDVKNIEHLLDLERITRHTLTTVVEEFVTTNFGLTWPVHLKVDVEVGDTWDDLTTVEKYVLNNLKR